MLSVLLITVVDSCYSLVAGWTKPWLYSHRPMSQAIQAEGDEPPQPAIEWNEPRGSGRHDKGHCDEPGERWLQPERPEPYRSALDLPSVAEMLEQIRGGKLFDAGHCPEGTEAPWVP